ncbi:ABC transporter ATP-binding protein [Erysipelothrix sp. HDW6B]|uniref:ABC transporter ATP-binding protein n=1 Tax=Erysipelothrix sp. HDW6B TaxID=2714929 RepID=UPI00140ABA63|nr:ABC transporter ATP-binding protein [Erysipelothrix sp. HDW6B]QIK85381.1 ABC transporter ATP-binding protein [Erysipelothrix sp. HDW6B]
MDYFKGYKFKSVAAVTAKLVEAIFELILPLLMATLVDQGIKGQDMNVVYRMVIWMFVLTLFGYISSLVCQYLASHVSQRVGGRIRTAVFAKIMGFSKESYDLYPSATLANRITTDINLIQDMIARVIRLGVRAPILMIGSLVALSAISGKLSLLLLASFPLFVLVVVGFMFMSMFGHKKAASQLDRLVSKVSESLSGVRIIRAFSKQDDSKKTFDQENELLEKYQRKVGVITTLSSPVTTLIMNLVLVVLIYVGAMEIQVGTMTQGEIIAVINYCTQLVLTLIVTMNIMMIFSRGYTSSIRVRDIMQTEVVVSDTGTETIKDSMILQFDDVYYHYPEEKRNVIQAISFELKPGEVMGIVGLTGSGKSTLLKLIPRFADATQGTVRINNQPIQDYQLKNLRDNIGFVSQSAQFIKGSLEYNILLGGSGDASQALIDAQGADILNKGLDSVIEMEGKNLSGGQRQRVSIARALAKKPKILVFDDSFSALDFLTDRNLRDSLAKNYASMSQIIVSQRTTSVMGAHKILVLDDGKIVASGTHDELMQASELYATIHRIQTEGGQTNEKNESLSLT